MVQRHEDSFAPQTSRFDYKGVEVYLLAHLSPIFSNTTCSNAPREKERAGLLLTILFYCPWSEEHDQRNQCADSDKSLDCQPRLLNRGALTVPKWVYVPGRGGARGRQGGINALFTLATQRSNTNKTNQTWAEALRPSEGRNVNGCLVQVHRSSVITPARVGV